MSDRQDYSHPSGPGLPGHPHCGPGQIYSHTLHRCTSVFRAIGDTKGKLKRLRELQQPE